MTKFLLPLALITVTIIAFGLGGRFSLGKSIGPIVVTDSQAEVDVQATYSSNQIELALNTHSVDLTDFDFSQSVILRTKNSELKTVSAVPVSDSPPHHRTYALTFPKFSLPVTLIIKNLGGIPERKLIFERG